MVTGKILAGEFGDVWGAAAVTKRGQGEKEEKVVMQSRKVLEGLNLLATEKLSEIVRHTKAGTKGWQGYDLSEVDAAEELLGADEQKTVR